MRPTTSPLATPPRRALRRLIALLAGGSMTGHTILTAAIGVPMLMIATPAQAAGSCSGSNNQLFALYSSGGSALDAKSINPFLSCSGTTANSQYLICARSNITTSTNGLSGSYFLAKSSSGQTIKFGLQYGVPSARYNIADGSGTIGYSDIGYFISDSNGNFGGRPTTAWGSSSDTAGQWLTVPQQTVQAGDYTAIVNVGMVLQPFLGWGANPCVQSDILSFTVATPILIRVGGSCDLAAIDPINFGQITASGGSLSTKTVAFYVPVVCLSGQSYTMTNSNGSNATGSGNYQRRLVSGSSFIPYGIFTDSSSSTPFPAGGIAGTGTGVATDRDPSTPYYATIPAGQSTTGLASGTYSDTLIATVAW